MRRLARQKKALELLNSGQLDDKEAAALLYDWSLWARDSQLEPTSVDWVTWLILAGRGYGKTRTGSETVIGWAKAGWAKRIALVGSDAADARDVMVEGDSGIMECSPRDFIPIYEPSKKRLTWPNGCRAYLFSAEDPDSLRGPQFHAAWCDELCKWAYGQETWDNLQMGLRLGVAPRQIVTTTPRPIKLLKEIILRSDTVITKGSTHENLANLAKPFRKAVIDRYEGTRLGRQELNAELLDDIPGAMWQRSKLDETRATRHEDEDMVTYQGAKVDMAEIVVAVDPPTSSGENSDECGIVAAGKGRDARGYVLADVSLGGTPDEWGTAAVRLFDSLKANWMIYEANQGGEMVAHVLRSCAKALRDKGERDTDHIPLRAVHATRGKSTRAEPVSALYEQGRVSHVGYMALLEDQMCEFTPDFDKDKAGYSPDRVDALVWALTGIMVEKLANEGLMEFMRLENERVQQRLSGATAGTQIAAKAKIPLQPPKTVGQAHGGNGQLYKRNKDGYMEVDEDDVVPLIRAGFVRVLT